jgi:hypothetical protein
MPYSRPHPPPTEPPVVPALPLPGLVFRRDPHPQPPRVSDDEIKGHYTRLQILYRAMEFSDPDMRCQLDDHKENRSCLDDSGKILTVSNFVAFSLVRDSSADVVAVSIDTLPGGVLSVVATRNTPAAGDVAQAEALKNLFHRHFLADRSASSSFETFREDYLRKVLSWGNKKYVGRLSKLKNGGGTGQKSTGRAKNRMTLGKVYFAMKALVLDVTKREKIVDIENKHLVAERAVLRATGETSYIRGDNNLVFEAKAQNTSTLMITISYLRYVHRYAKEFYAAFERCTDGSELGREEYEAITTVTTLCDMLGSSRIFEDYLDLTEENTSTARYCFGRSLRKIGHYRYGIWKLWNAMTNCAGKYIKENQGHSAFLPKPFVRLLPFPMVRIRPKRSILSPR